MHDGFMIFATVLAGFTAGRGLHPAPKVFMWLIDYIRLCFDDALDRADGHALGRIEMAHALDTGGGVDYVDGIAFGDRVGGALRQAGAAGNAIFVDLHCHKIVLLLISYDLSCLNYFIAGFVSNDKCLVFDLFCHGYQG
jgi:hypothetical protein